jgi:ferritin heavy chain
MSLVRQNFHAECEAALNKQINIELHASYVYMSMAWYFDREDVALPGMHKFCKKNSDEEREHAEEIMKYQNMRGGRIILQNVEKPPRDTWGSALEAMQAALEMEKNINQTLIELHATAGKHGDSQMCDWLEDHFLKEAVDTIKKLAQYVTNLKRCGAGLGEYTFDHEELAS